MKLYLCEKPSQANDIGQVLGGMKKQSGYLESKDTLITWGFGHLLECAPPHVYEPSAKTWQLEGLPIIPDEWQMQVKHDDKGGAKKQFELIKKLLKKVDEVVIATDADREGEVIAREILEACGFHGTLKRLWLSALDGASIQKALQQIKPGAQTQSLYQAGLARQRADWLMGMNLTRAVTKAFGFLNLGVLSVGRVQTPTLNLVVARDLAIENFSTTRHYGLKATVQLHPDYTLSADWQPEEAMLDSLGYIQRIDTVEAVLKTLQGQSACVTQFENKPKTTHVPVCLSLSTLQTLASSQLGLGAKTTLEIAQSLYEKHKATTYPRTDCGYLPVSQFQDAPDILNQVKTYLPEFKQFIENCDLTYQSNTWNDKKVTAHHGIIPTTNTQVGVSNFNTQERAVYALIIKYYLAQFLGDYEYQALTLQCSIASQSFKATAQTPRHLGWKQAFTIDKSEPETNSPFESSLNLTVGDTLKVTDLTISTKDTKAPARFTEGTLIQAMKNIGNAMDEKAHQKIFKSISGIGTEATRANIIENLLQKKYLAKEKKTIVSTPKGRALVKLLPDALVSAVTTAQWEEHLESIVSETITLDKFMQAQAAFLKKTLQVLILKAKVQKSGQLKEGLLIPCPETACEDIVLKKQGKKSAYWQCQSGTCGERFANTNDAPGQRFTK